MSSTPAVLKPAASPSRTARADALEQIAAWSLYTGGIKLTGAAYQHLGALGLNRAYVSQAADRLAKEGRMTISVEEGVVVLRLTRKGRNR